MRLLITLTLAIATISAASAQQKTTADYTLTVTPQDIGVIGQALGELPYKASAQLINKLNAQISEQDAARNKPESTPVPAPRNEDAPK